MENPSESMLRILIVDDNESFCIGLRDILVLHGHFAEYITKGEELGSALESTVFDAVIMDLRLPNFSGIDLASFVKAGYPGVACIISTAHGSTPVVIEALNKGFIEKPYRFEDLFQVLERGVRIAKTRALESEIKRLSRFPEENTSPVLRVDKTGTILYANSASKPLLDAQGVEVGEMIPEQTWMLVSEILRTGIPGEIEASVDERTYELRIIPIPEEDYVNIYGKDVTVQRQSEQALLTSEAKYRGFLDGSRDGVTVNVLGKLVYVNPCFAELMGYGVDELVGTSIIDLHSPEYQKLIRDRTRRRSMGEVVPSQYEVELVRRDGSLVPVEYSVSVISYEGEPASLTFIRDISERKRMEDALRESEDLFRGFMQSATDSFIIFDKNLHYLQVNDAWLKLAQYTREEISGKHILDVYPGIKETGRYEAYLKVLETGVPVDFHAVRSRTGSGVIYDVSAFKAGIFLGVAVKDVTERVHHRKQLESLNEHATQLASQESIEDAVSATFKIIEDIFGYNYGSFGIVEGEYIHHIIVPQVSEIDDFYQPLNGSGICPRAVRTGVTQVVNETRDDPDFSITVAEGVYMPRSELVVPIHIDGKVAAVLNVESILPGAFSDGDVRLVELLANHVRSNITRIQYFEQLSLQVVELEASKDRWEELISSIPDPVLINNSSHYLYANQQAVDLWGYDSPSDIVGHEVSQFFSEEDVPFLVQRAKDRLEGATVPNRYEQFILRKDGSIVPVEVNIKVINYDGAPAILSIHRDISERKQRENALRESEELFRGFMQSASDVFILHDENLCYLEVNDRWVQRTGIKREDVIGKRMVDVFPNSSDGDRVEAYLKVLETGESAEFHAVESYAKSGRLLDIKAFKTGDNLGIISRDVSDTVKYQRRFETLHSHAVLMSSAETYDDVAEITYKTIKEVIGFDRGSFGVVENQELHHRYRWNMENPEPFKMPLTGPGITVRAVNTGETQLVNNVLVDQEYFTNLPNRKAVTLSELVVPVRIKGTVVAVINLESTVLNAFSQNDQRLIETLAQNVGATLTRLQNIEEKNKLEKTINESNLRLRNFLDSMDIGLAIWDKDFNYVDVNQTVLDRMVLSREQLIGKNIIDIDPEIGETGRLEAYKRVIETGEPYSSDDLIITTVNGDRRFSIKSYLVGDGLGHITRDITEEYRMIRELRESEERYRSLFDDSAAGILIRDKSGTITAINRKGAEIYGFESHELIGKQVSSLWANPSIHSTAVKSLTEPGMSSEIIIDIRKKDGTLGVIAATGSVRFDGEGNLSSVETYFRDVSEEYRLLSEIRVSEERYRVFSESASESFVLFDSELNLVNINTIGAERLGLAKDEALGRHMLDIMPELRDSLRYDTYLEVLRTGESQIFDVVDHFSGIILLRINAFKVGDGLGILATDLSELVQEQKMRERLFVELTAERLQLDQEQELGRLKDQFISTATHELRTPVTSIIGYIELILTDTNQNISDQVRKDLNVVFRNANRLVTLTNDLLDVQRITSGRFEVNREQVDLVSILNEVVEELSPLFTVKQQKVDVAFPKELRADVDETRISQLFINLLRNANKFTPSEGNITVKVEPSEDHVTISVKDSGIGLSEDDMGKLFVPFPGINHGLGESSTGLGLAICKGIIDMHNGEIWAESEGHGTGSIFYVKLPL